VRQLNYDNKLKLQEVDTKIKFNVSMHGKKAGDIVKYSAAGHDLQTNIRRRLADNDNSVETLNGGDKLKYNMLLFATNYNILRIRSGMAGLAFAN